MKCKVTILMVGLLACYGKLLAQDYSNKGKDFWVGYGHHQYMEPGQNNSQNMVLYLSAEQPATVTVTIRGISATQVNTYNIPANTVITTPIIPKTGIYDARLFDLPPSFCPPNTCFGGETLFKRSIHIQSDVPIVAYAHIYGSVSSGATMLLPTETWGYSYTTINSQQIDALGPAFSWVYVVAKDSNTRVRITPSVITRLGKPAGVPFDTTLHKGDIFQIIGQSDANGNGNQFTGTTVTSIANASGECYPIAVFAGSSRTKGEQVPCGASSGRDNDMQQCFPQQAWGNRYLTAPFSTASGSTANPTLNASTFMTSVYKIIVKDPATVVKRNGVALVIGASGYYQFSSNTADYIEADKPIMVGQFMSGASGCNPGTWGDPEMVYLSPIEQAIKKVGFYRNNKELIYANYVTVVIPTAGIASLLIDGSPVFNYTYVHPNLAGYSVVVKGWTAAQAQCLMQSDSAFTAITYGLGGAESYGYNAGTYIKNLNAVGSLFNVSDTSTITTSHPFTCTNTPVELSVYLKYPTPPSKLVWKLSDLGSAITPNLDVTDNSPTPVGAPVVIGAATYLKYVLAGTYSFSSTGTFTIPILVTHPSIENCTNTERVSYEVIVKAKPLAGFTFTHSGCISDPVQFNGPASTGNGYTLNQWLWTFPGAVTNDTQNPTHIFTATGNQPVTLHVVTTEGCVSDSIQQVPIYPKPTVTISTLPANASVCEGGDITFSGNVSFGGSGSISNYQWNFGNSITNTDPGPHTINYPLPGIYTAYFIAGVSNACKSDTVFRLVPVYAKPTTGFTYPAGCLPASGTVQFTSTPATPDGQAITGHSWNFGDPGSGAANTSNLANPTHNYSAFGNYTITYSVTTANGCTKDTTVNAVFNLPPAFNYPALPAVCYNAPAVSVATASVTNGVTGAGEYHGPGTTLAGSFTASLAGAGTHTIWYVFTTSAGCKDSISKTITVHPRVGANFVIPTATCLPASGNVQFNYSGTLSAGQQYLWNFGDPGSGGLNTSALQNPTHNYTTGPYIITLTVTDVNGCADDSIMNANFTVKPALAYPALASVCESDAGTVSIATASVTNGVPGSGVYHGSFTSLAGDFNPSLAGAGTHTVWYVYTATGSCVDSISQTITVKPKPLASFTIPAAACLPVTGLVQFTSNGSTGAGTQWLWNFGDPGSGAANTSLLQNPSHNYSNTGSHNVQLTVTAGNGCVDDTIIVRTFSVTPALIFPALNPVCESVGGVISVASATVTNAVSGTGVYSGTGTSANGDFDPAVAGPGTHNIIYTFTSTGNCIGTANTSITVYPKPSASFNATANVCADQQVSFTNIVAAGAGNITSWKWYFGDASTITYNNNNSFARFYAGFGNYTAKLVTVNNNGCTSDTATAPVSVHAMPIADFNPPAFVCMPGDMVFVNTSDSPDGAVLTYNWDFGDGTGTSITIDGIYTYATIGSYNIQLTATSSFGCVHDTIKTFSSFYDKPIADFEVNPSNVCQGVAIQLTDHSTAPNSNIASHQWLFGDGTVSQDFNPVKTYSSAGGYTIKLIVVNQQGCISDTAFNTVTVYPQPVVEAGESFIVQQGTNITFNATVNDPASFTLLWSPASGLSNANSLHPSLQAMSDQTYTLVATGAGNCTSSDFLTVKIYKPVKIPNAFSPNGDLTNDTWIITNITDYAGATVDVFNRYGQKIFSSVGYSVPWDGNYNGKPLPVATYYYIVDLKNGFKPLNGSITIIR